MTNRPYPSPRILRGSFLALALLAAPACMVGDPDVHDPALLARMPDVDCSGVAEWKQNTQYAFGDIVTDTGHAFSALVAHTSFGIDWNPKNAASLWGPVGHCVDGGGEPPPPPPPGDDGDDGDDGGGDDGGGDDPPPPPAEGCSPNGRPGPLFDPAGVPNVGNGEGDQFIGGQCLDASDCASGCCALPCGICSGPGAQFQNGKQGCGFES